MAKPATNPSLPPFALSFRRWSSGFWGLGLKGAARKNRRHRRKEHSSLSLPTVEDKVPCNRFIVLLWV